MQSIGRRLVLSWSLLTAAAYPAAGADAPAKPAAPTEALAPAYVALMLARDATVQRELGLTDAQLQPVASAVAEVDQPLWLLRDVPLETSQPQLDQLLGQLRKQLGACLSPAQLERFEQLILRARGYPALVAPDMAARLKLSPQQVERMRAAMSGTAQATSKVSATSSSSSSSTAALSAAQVREISEVLTPEQSAQLAKLVGQPFDLTRVRRVGCQAPELREVAAWIPSSPLTLSSQRGKVVVLHFWAFGCINCIRNLPHYQAWHQQFPESELTIIGLHTPETGEERSVDALRKNITQRGITYPVAFDAAAANWKAWGNSWWPSVYLIDKQGRVRYWWYGELNWQGATGEQFLRGKIAELIAEAE